MSSPAATHSPLTAPNLVLPVGFAGKRQLDTSQTATTRTSLPHVFRTIAHRLHSRILADHHHPDSTPGPWSLQSLHLSEKIANDFVQEVAEWSVLYAKELVEP